MAYIDTWRDNLKQDLAVFAPLAAQDRNLDEIYGVTAAAVLWGVRKSPFNPEQLEALKTCCEDEQHHLPLQKAVGGWDAMSPLEAARSLDKRQKQDTELKAAISTLMGHFVDVLLTEKMIRKNIHIEGNVSGANVILGTQVVVGDLIIQYLRQKTERACPKPMTATKAFRGRDDEYEKLAALLTSGQNCAITALQGMGGIGKTTLAQVLAERLYEQKVFRAVLWAQLTRSPEPLGILQSWVARCADSSFNISQIPNAEDAALAARDALGKVINDLCDTCDGNRVLVIVDDVWENGVAALNLLKKAFPERSTLLLTTRDSRVVNSIDGEQDSQIQRFPVGRLDVPRSVELLKYYLSDYEETTLERLGKALGGHPLAMKLACTRVKNDDGEPGESQEQTLMRCTADYEQGIPAGTPFERLDLKALGDDRDNDLEKSLWFSYERLNTDDQRRFRALGTLAYDEPFDALILAILWQAEPESVNKFCKILRQLSLIEVEETNVRVGFYRQHPLLRSYARALLNQSQETAEAFSYYTDAVIAITNGFGNLPQEEWGLLDPYVPHIHFVGDQLAEQFASGSPKLREQAGAFSLNSMRYLNSRPEALFTLQKDGRLPTRLNWMTMGLALWREQENPAREATTLNNIGMVWSALGEKHKALDFLEQALPLLRAVGDRGGEANTLNNIGMVWSALGEKHKALDFLEQALPLLRAVGDRGGEANTLNNIGMVWSALGEKHKALDFLEQALPLRRAVGDRGGEASTLNNIGGVWDALGEKHKALDFYEQALAIFIGVKAVDFEAAQRVNIAFKLAEMGEWLAAIQHVEMALRLMRQYQLPFIPGNTSLQDVERLLTQLQQGQSNSSEANRLTLPDDTVQTLAGNTVAVKTEVPDKLDQWRNSLQGALDNFNGQGADWVHEVAFVVALLGIVDDQRPKLTDDNPYKGVVQQVNEAIDQYKQGGSE